MWFVPCFFQRSILTSLHAGNFWGKKCNKNKHRYYYYFAMCGHVLSPFSLCYLIMGVNFHAHFVSVMVRGIAFSTQGTREQATSHSKEISTSLSGRSLSTQKDLWARGCQWEKWLRSVKDRETSQVFLAPWLHAHSQVAVWTFLFLARVRGSPLNGWSLVGILILKCLMQSLDKLVTKLWD